MIHGIPNRPLYFYQKDIKLLNNKQLGYNFDGWAKIAVTLCLMVFLGDACFTSDGSFYYIVRLIEYELLQCGSPSYKLIYNPQKLVRYKYHKP